MPDPAAVRAAIDAIEAELRRLGWWQETALTPEQMAFSSPFGMDTMGFSQWLQFVLVPSVRARLAAGGPWPKSSGLAAHATREWDGAPMDVDPLIARLSDLDRMFSRR
jgi:uncharacterized protein YqcC (DUF446 family)